MSAVTFDNRRFVPIYAPTGEDYEGALNIDHPEEFERLMNAISEKDGVNFQSLGITVDVNTLRIFIDKKLVKPIKVATNNYKFLVWDGYDCIYRRPDSLDESVAPWTWELLTYMMRSN